jgi:ATP-dependent DNA ligase
MAELDAGADGYQAAVKIKQPMLPQISPSPLTSVKIPIGRPNWVYELEHDGFRGILYVDREQAWLVSRKRKKFHQFEPLLKQVRVLPRDPTATSCWSFCSSKVFHGCPSVRAIPRHWRQYLI